MRIIHLRIYSVGKNQSYGRLEIASQGMTDVLKKSICLDDYLEAKETIVSGKVVGKPEFPGRLSDVYERDSQRWRARDADFHSGSGK